MFQYLKAFWLVSHFNTETIPPPRKRELQGVARDIYVPAAKTGLFQWELRSATRPS